MEPKNAIPIVINQAMTHIDEAREFCEEAMGAYKDAFNDKALAEIGEAWFKVALQLDALRNLLAESQSRALEIQCLIGFKRNSEGNDG